MTREHWIQGVAIVAPLGMLGLITMVSTTWILSNEIGSVRADNMAQVSVLSSKIAADEERIAAMERVESSHYADDVAFRTEMRNGLGVVINGLADVRVIVGNRKDGAK